MFDGTFTWKCADGVQRYRDCPNDGHQTVINGEYFGTSASNWWSRQQSAIAYSSDRKTLYFAASSSAKTMQELHDVLVQVGARNALKLDGGCCSALFYNDGNGYINRGATEPNAWIVIPNDNPPPPPQTCPSPSLQEPSNGFVTTNRTMTFKWDDVSCQHSGFTYRVKTVPDMDSGGQTVVDTGVGGTQRTETFGSQWDNRDLYWSVRAANAPGGASWASARAFRISPNAPPSISFDTANGNSSNQIDSRDRNWTFRGTASDPEGRLSAIDFRCDSCDNRGSGPDQTSGNNWSLTRNDMAGQNDVYFVAHDDVQTTASRHLDLRIDLAPPATTLSLNNEADPARWPIWFTGPVQMRLHADDGNTGRARSGVGQIRYQLDGGALQTVGNDATFTVNNDGSHSVTYYAVDNVGNQEASRTINFKIDQTPPPPPSGVVETHGVVSDQWQKTQSTPTFTWAASTDVTSGVWGYQFYFDTDPNGVTIQRTFTAAEQRQWTPQPNGVRTGTYYLRGRTRDNAGNWSAWTTLFIFRYDNTPPENPTGVRHAANITSTVWQTTTRLADFTWSVPHDEGSGIKGYYVFWGDVISGTSSTFITANRFQSATPLCDVNAACTGYLRLRSVDNVDNQATDWTTAFVLRYDNVPPVADFTFNGGVTQTNQTQVILRLNASDVGSGVQAMRFSLDGQNWTAWEAYASERLWEIPGISRQSWSTYVQVRDGVGLVSSIISRTVYLDVNVPQPRSDNYRLFDYLMSAGGGAHTDGVYTGASTVGQVVDSAWVSSTTYLLKGGYQAGALAIPTATITHEVFSFINGIFASGTGATTLTSTTFLMQGTLGEPGLPIVPTIASAGFQLQPGFLAASPRRGTPSAPPPSRCPPDCPPPPPTLACEFPRISINNGALFTNSANVSLNICAPRARDMILSNDGGFGGAVWISYTSAISWTLDIYKQFVLPRFVYAAFRDVDGKIQNTYFDDIIYDPTPPNGSLTVGDSIPASLALQDAAARNTKTGNVWLAANGSIKYIQRTGSTVLNQPLALLRKSVTGTVDIYVSAADDNSGLSDMQLSASSAFTDTAWEPFTALKLWTPSGEDGVKAVYARFRDSAGNISPSANASFVLDSQPPVGGIALAQRVVGPKVITLTVYLGAEDNLSGVMDMRVSANASFTDAVWLPYTTTLTWNISLTGQSQGTLYAQYRDLAGNVSDVYSDTYTVDTTPPVLYVDVPTDTTLTRNITVFAYDELSDVALMRLSNDPLMIDGVVTMPYTPTVTWTFDERRVVWVQLEDGVGNVSQPYPAYAAGPTTNNLYLPLIFKNE